MKVLLGDNQFFGVNHFDLQKGEKSKELFSTSKEIEQFIVDALGDGMDGFMINSNKTGYALISSCTFDSSKEIHYSIPYPHKYANMVNESGMLSLLTYCLKETSIINNIVPAIKLLFTRNLKYFVKFAIDLEVPRNLKVGSYIYLQNIVTDLIVGMGRGDIIIQFIREVKKMGYKPGIISLNPVLLNNILVNVNDATLLRDLIVCFNINKEGFNVFPSVIEVEELVKSKPPYLLMGMSIFASGSANISASVEYIKQLKLDYVVFGTSKRYNVITNLKYFKKQY